VIVAGVDVGNATTEVVVLSQSHGSPRLLGAARAATRGAKGSASSLRAAAHLVTRLEHSTGESVDHCVVAPLRAVSTRTVSVPEPGVATGRLRLVAAGVRTPGGHGHGVGRPWRLGTAGRPDGPVVVLAPRDVAYAAAAAAVRGLVTQGVDVRAVLVEGDEAVLVANRLDKAIPVLDQVALDDVAGSVAQAVEVREPGRSLVLLTDPIALSSALGLDASELVDAAAMTRLMMDRSNGVVALGGDTRASGKSPEAWIRLGGRRYGLGESCARVATEAVGAVTAYGLSAAEDDRVDDLFCVDLGDAADRARSRQGSVASRAYLIAALGAGGSEEAAGFLATELGVAVLTAPSEAAAARAGALTTPGAEPLDVVVDLGAGTIDAIGPISEVVAAGAGELLTQAVAGVLGLTRSAGDWVKRGPCVRVEGGQRFESEDGSRGFLPRPAPAALTGMLAVEGPAGLLPFDRRHTPAEWRALRLRLKEAIFGANLRRVLAEFGPGVARALVVGGPAADDELLGVVARSVPPSVVVGRARVGETLKAAPGVPELGSRYAAALGLCLHGLEVP
jgi:hypothetical protein